MLEKISGIDFLAKEVWYHAICRSNYQSRTDNIIKKSYSVENNVWHDTRKSHSNTFSEIYSLVQESVIEKETVYFMSELTSQYKSILLEKTGEDDINFTSQHLEDKLVKHFGEQIMFNNGNKKRGNIIYKKGMDLEHVIREAFDSRRQLRVQIKDLAYKLRKCILDSPHTPLPEDLKIADILKGEIVSSRSRC